MAYRNITVTQEQQICYPTIRMPKKYNSRLIQNYKSDAFIMLSFFHVLIIYVVSATEAYDDDGLPHTLEHLVFMGSEEYPYKVRKR